MSAHIQMYTTHYSSHLDLGILIYRPVLNNHYNESFDQKIHKKNVIINQKQRLLTTWYRNLSIVQIV